MAHQAGKQIEAYSTLDASPLECPFREFRDSELMSVDTWGVSPGDKTPKSGKHTKEQLTWIDPQLQPLPRSVRKYVQKWEDPQEHAERRWEAEIDVYEQDDYKNVMVMKRIQATYSDLLNRSSFCRKVFSVCFILERLDNFVVEHQWEGFIFATPPEGWRAKMHIYSPGLKSGGGTNHRPGLSKNGCYLVRLFFMGKWRCVWVNDLVPVDERGNPLLPFCPLVGASPAMPQKRSLSMVKGKQAPEPPPDTSSTPIFLWPMLLCKALLKLAVPDIQDNEHNSNNEDEEMSYFSIVHALTGCLEYKFPDHLLQDIDELWHHISVNVHMFQWEEEEEVKGKGAKKPTPIKEIEMKSTYLNVYTKDTKDVPPYKLQGLFPCHEALFLIEMARDVPVKKPLPEPEVLLWKTYRWVNWAKKSGLYAAYQCPRDRFLKLYGLLKLSYAPHLQELPSTDSLTGSFAEKEGRKPTPQTPGKKIKNSQTNIETPDDAAKKEQYREWISYDGFFEHIQSFCLICLPSLFNFTTAIRYPISRGVKPNSNPALDIFATKYAPLYFQVDAPKDISVFISLSSIHPRVFINCGNGVDYTEKAHLVLEKFEWFENDLMQNVKGHLLVRGIDSMNVTFPPGRHFCRIWVHSHLNWYLMVMSQSNIVLGPRSNIISAASIRRPWVSIFLNNLGNSFLNWIKLPKPVGHLGWKNKDFYESYLPDLKWDEKIAGCKQVHIHDMFKTTLISLLSMLLQFDDYYEVCSVLRYYFKDPNFGMKSKPDPPNPTPKKIAETDPCDCTLPEIEALELEVEVEETPFCVPEEVLEKLVQEPQPPATSQICELATEDLPCGILKMERQKLVLQHEAATLLQAHWRGTFTRRCLFEHPTLTPEVLKLLTDNVFGSIDTQALLMNEFFRLHPMTKHAYSISTGLSGGYNMTQYRGTALISTQCKWVPLFQATFYCHEPVKVHFDLTSSVDCQTVEVYDNDTKTKVPQVYNHHLTFDMNPNIEGYTVQGHSTILTPLEASIDAMWVFTVMTSRADVFHVCDNAFVDGYACREYDISMAQKFHIDELYIPNRRNILGGVQITVGKTEILSFRAAACYSELEMIATLKKVSGADSENEKIIDQCEGKGEIYWPYIHLYFDPIKSSGMPHLQEAEVDVKRHAKQSIIHSIGGKGKSIAEMKKIKVFERTKKYVIEVTTPKSWALTLDQWRRVIVARSTILDYKPVDAAPVKAREKANSQAANPQAQPPRFKITQDDAYVELECALFENIKICRDDQRDLKLAALVKSWAVKDPTRNSTGASIRAAFRAESLEVAAPQMTDDTASFFGEEFDIIESVPAPTPQVTEVVEEEDDREEPRYITMPAQLKEKFAQLSFVSLCTKPVDENNIRVASINLLIEEKTKRYDGIQNALERMENYQLYNELHILARQKRRTYLIEKMTHTPLVREPSAFIPDM